jgi:hypothetical protein
MPVCCKSHAFAGCAALLAFQGHASASVQRWVAEPACARGDAGIHAALMAGRPRREPGQGACGGVGAGGRRHPPAILRCPTPSQHLLDSPCALVSALRPGLWPGGEQTSDCMPGRQRHPQRCSGRKGTGKPMLCRKRWPAVAHARCLACHHLLNWLVRVCRPRVYAGAGARGCGGVCAPRARGQGLPGRLGDRGKDLRRPSI